MSAFDRLIEQIDAFIRKFYKNQIIKGLLFFIGVFVVSYLLVISLEYFGRFNSIIRGVLLFSFLGMNGFILVKYIIRPILKLNEYGSRINRYQASSIIGKFFPAVSDRLLNTLQLSDKMDVNSADFELLNASVQQKSSTMTTVPFTEAVDLNENKRYILWLVPIVFILGLVGLFSPSVITQGTDRVINFSQEFVVPPPFTFLVKSKGLTIEEGESFVFDVELEGKELPEKVYINSQEGRFLLSRISKNKFHGKIDRVRNSLIFHFEANQFQSEEYNLSVISKTAISKLQATLNYPTYLGKESEVIENAGDLILNEGTTVTWSVLTKNTSEVNFITEGQNKTFKNGGFTFKKQYKQNANGLIVLKNRQSNKRDTTFFTVDVIKDAYPTIIAEQVLDTLKDGVRYFSGVVGDDYGLNSLTFVYEILRQDGSSKKEKLSAGKVFGTESPFNFAVDFRKEQLSLEDKISYYFVVTDNDGVNGSKSSTSRTFEYRLPSLDELNESRDDDRQEEWEGLMDVLKQAEKFKDDLDKLRNETRSSKRTDWNKQNQVNQLQEDHKSILENLKEVQEDMQNSLEEKSQLSEIDKELLEQQEMINDLLEELMDEELRDLLDQLEKLMNEQNKDALDKNMEQMEMSADDMKNQLDRSLEMLKRLQVNEKIDDIEKELEELAKEQDKVKEESEGKKDVSEKNLEDQKKIKEKFEELEKDLKELDSLNQELKTPMELGEEDRPEDQINDHLNDAEEKLEKNKGDKAGESQKSASDKMKEMASDLNAKQEQANKKKQEEDIDALRNILESLISLSFDQEFVMGKFSNVNENDPAYKSYSKDQRRIIDDTKLVRDSLFALAERQPKIAQFIDKELNQIKVNHDLSVEDIDERRRRELKIHQQYVMTSYNNLALLLNESLQQMQSQMQSMMQGSGSCDKPGGKGQPKSGNSPSSGDMKEMLKKQLEQMKDGGSQPGGNEKGDKPGGSKPGGQGSMGMGNKQVAKMAAEQSAIRRRLEQLRNELNKDGKGSGNGLTPLIQELEQQEKDLVNKRLGAHVVERQKRILTRLLDNEKALIERGLDEKRESSEGNNQNNGNQIIFDEYNKEKLRQIELLRAVDPAYNKYYKDKANEYFNRVL